MNGIDISGWQPGSILNDINQNYDFVIIKITEGTNIANQNLTAQLNSVQDGKILGLYHFMTTDNPTTQAEVFYNNGIALTKNFIPVLDYEADAISLGKNHVTQFCNRYYQLSGVKPLLYASYSVIQSQDLDVTTPEAWAGIWVAAYYSSNPIYGYNPPLPPPMTCSIWQYSSTGRLAGYSGNLDFNVSLDDYLLKPENYVDGNGPKKKIFTDEQIILAISENYRDNKGSMALNGAVAYLLPLIRSTLNGLKGNDAERVEKLGKNYDIVQKIINILYEV